MSWSQATIQTAVITGGATVVLTAFTEAWGRRGRRPKPRRQPKQQVQSDLMQE